MALATTPMASTRNAGALARARAANSLQRGSSLNLFGSGKALYRNLDEADDKVALVGEDLSAAVETFFGSEAAQLQRQAMPTAALPPAQVGAPAPAADDAARTQLAASIARKMAEAEPEFAQVRGLLKKRGGAARGLSVTWHWRFCVLHRHALAVHDGKDRPKELRSAVPLKHVLRVEAATAAECGERDFAFALRTDLEGGRSWIFCCMGEDELQQWLRALRAACALTHGGGLASALR